MVRVLGGGYGDGDGYGGGYGDGSGDGSGYGDGSGDGEPVIVGFVAVVDGKDVNVFLGGYLRVGCQIHTIEWWRENWQATAETEDVEVDEQEAMAIIAKAERIISQ